VEAVEGTVNTNSLRRPSDPPGFRRRRRFASEIGSGPGPARRSSNYLPPAAPQSGARYLRTQAESDQGPPAGSSGRLAGPCGHAQDLTPVWISGRFFSGFYPPSGGYGPFFEDF
jgi:hypothetical protein